MKTISIILGFLIESTFIQKLLKLIECQPNNLTNTIDCLGVENSKFYDIYFNILLINRTKKNLGKYKYISHIQLNTKKILIFIKAFIRPKVLELDYTLSNNKKNQLIYGKV